VKKQTPGNRLFVFSPSGSRARRQDLILDLEPYRGNLFYKNWHFEKRSCDSR
jgi:hypothetical protein